ncbi:hypothetical protein ACP70R_007034 [Stipagrostis hirtigluma subsp. patula]
MAVGVAPPALGRAAAVIGGGDGAEGEGASEVTGKEEPLPVEGVPGTGMEGKGAPAAIAVEGEKEGDEQKEQAATVVVAEAAAAAEEEEEKWLKHYSSRQSILTVGDGDFSFSLALATVFGSGAHLVATSLDTYEVLKCKYSKAESNIMQLKILEATVLHGVDVKRMKFHTDLKNRRFQRIVFNFPHAGFRAPEDHMINLHKELLKGFFRNACHLLKPYGEIHVSHKTGQPYEQWDLEDLASELSLIVVENVSFQKADYPGYNQKRGDGTRSDQPFPLGRCCTYKFQIGDLKKRKKLNGNKSVSVSSLGGSNVHPYTLAAGMMPFHPLQLPQFPPPVNPVQMLIALQHYAVAQMQQPGFPLNFNGIVRAPYLYQQGTVHPMLSMPGPSHAPGSIPPPMGRIACSNLHAPQERPSHQQRTIVDPPGRDNYSYFEYQRCLQREREMQRQTMMPGATGLSYSAFLEDRRRESVQKIALGGRQ